MTQRLFQIELHPCSLTSCISIRFKNFKAVYLPIEQNIHEMVVMPNHFHCIIDNMPINATIRDERGRPENNYGINNQKYNSTIGDDMDWFKTMTTNEYICSVKTNNWQPFNKKLWQRNYWEHIICNQQSYLKISDYTIKNPANWDNDTLK